MCVFIHQFWSVRSKSMCVFAEMLHVILQTAIWPDCLSVQLNFSCVSVAEVRLSAQNDVGGRKKYRSCPRPLRRYAFIINRFRLCGVPHVAALLCVTPSLLRIGLRLSSVCQSGLVYAKNGMTARIFPLQVQDVEV